MDQPQQPPFIAVPPWWQQPQQNAPQPTIENSVPARVRLAAEFSLAMARRAGPIVAVNDVGMQEFDPAPVTKPEQEAWNSACKLLTQYFDGTLLLDPWETLRQQAGAIETNRRKIGRVVPCPCKGSRDCPNCHGTGKVIVAPAE